MRVKKHRNLNPGETMTCITLECPQWLKEALEAFCMSRAEDDLIEKYGDRLVIFQVTVDTRIAVDVLDSEVE